MKKASNYAFLSRKRRQEPSEQSVPSLNRRNDLVGNYGGLNLNTQQDLNVFVVTFDGMKNAETNLAGGDSYECKKCTAVLNKYSKVINAKQYQKAENKHMKFQLKQNQTLWQCQFCSYPNILRIQLQQIPKKDDVVYMLESAHQSQVTENDSTIVFCIDTSGSMNTTSEVQGKIDLKYGLSLEQIQMLKQFMQPGDQAQFNFLPGNHNKNKTFISRKQCILSAIQNQLQQLKKVDPYKRVGFITFNNQVTVLGDGKTQTVNILGDKLNKKQQIVESLKNFKLSSPLGQSYQNLINSLNKTQAKGPTALGPALLSAIQVASKGSPGSIVVLCTDGLANIGVGSLDPFSQTSKHFYQSLSIVAKQKNIVINIITIKGQGAKMEIIGQLAKDTNGNIKVVNPQKLQDDFANVLKDQVVGLNVSVKIMLHKAMVFRNQNQQFLKDSKTILTKDFANATVNTRVSLQYQLRAEQDLKFMQIDILKLKTVPFQAQIVYTSPKGGKFLRVISSQSKTTMQKQVMKKDANIGVVHQRIASNTAQMFSKGQSLSSMQYNDMWSNYLNKQFTQQKYQKQQQVFNAKNKRLNNAIQQRSVKMAMRNPRQYQNQTKPSMLMHGQNSLNVPPMLPMKQQLKMEKFQIQNNFANNKSEICSHLGELSHISQMKQENEQISPQLFVQQQKMSEEKPGKKGKKAQRKKSVCLDSDQQQQQLMQNMMEKQCYDLD